MTVFENIAFGLRVRPRSDAAAASARSASGSSELLQADSAGLAGRPLSASSFPEDSGSAWLWRARWPSSRGCCCSTSRSARWMREVRKELRRWLRRLHDELHITSVFVTHDQEEALEVADRVAIMNQGQIEQVGTPAEVYDNPANAFVYQFLGRRQSVSTDVGGEGARLMRASLSNSISRGIRDENGCGVATVRYIAIGRSGGSARIETRRYGQLPGCRNQPRTLSGTGSLSGRQSPTLRRAIFEFFKRSCIPGAGILPLLTSQLGSADLSRDGQRPRGVSRPRAGGPSTGSFSRGFLRHIRTESGRGATDGHELRRLHVQAVVSFAFRCQQHATPIDDLLKHRNMEGFPQPVALLPCKQLVSGSRQNNQRVVREESFPGSALPTVATWLQWQPERRRLRRRPIRPAARWPNTRTNPFERNHDWSTAVAGAGGTG